MSFAMTQSHLLNVSTKEDSAPISSSINLASREIFGWRCSYNGPDVTYYMEQVGKILCGNLF